MDKEHSSLLVQFFAKIVGNIGIVWFLHQYFSALFVIENSVVAILIVGTAFGLVNFIVRPVLILLTYPLKVLASVLAVILVNGGIILSVMWLLPHVSSFTVTIGQGFIGWSITMTVIGLTNWAITELT